VNLPGEFGTGLALMNYSPLDRFLPNHFLGILAFGDSNKDWLPRRSSRVHSANFTRETIAGLTQRQRARERWMKPEWNFDEWYLFPRRVGLQGKSINGARHQKTSRWSAHKTRLRPRWTGPVYSG